MSGLMRKERDASSTATASTEGNSSHSCARRRFLLFAPSSPPLWCVSRKRQWHSARVQYLRRCCMHSGVGPIHSEIAISTAPLGVYGHRHPRRALYVHVQAPTPMHTEQGRGCVAVFPGCFTVSSGSCRLGVSVCATPRKVDSPVECMTKSTTNIQLDLVVAWHDTQPTQLFHGKAQNELGHTPAGRALHLPVRI